MTYKKIDILDDCVAWLVSTGAPVHYVTTLQDVVAHMEEEYRYGKASREEDC